MSTTRRSALCLYGRFNNRFSPTSGVDGGHYIRRKLLSQDDFDVFVYSNDTSHEATVRDLYERELTAAIFEEGPNFGQIMAKRGVREEIFKPSESFRTAENTLRFLYARMRSLELMKNHMEQTGTSYSSAVTCRFDLGQLDKYNGRQPYRVSEINFSNSYDMNYIYSAMWNQLNGGYADQWFFSNPETLLKLGDMFESALDYLLSGSRYQVFLENGIPDSNRRDEFSNEMLRTTADTRVDRVRVPMASGVNNHLIHKFFFMESGLYNISRFTSDFDGVAHVLYTHSDYSDIWPLYFGQQFKFFNGFSRNYVFVDQHREDLPHNYVQILYDDSLPYVDRLRDCLTRVREEFIFFDHEDMVLYDFPEMGPLLDYVNVVQTPSQSGGLDFIRLIRGGRYLAVRHRGARHLKRLLPASPWIFSIQPSFWKKSRLMALLQEHEKQHIWEFEAAAQASCRRLKIKGGFSSARGRKRGQMHWDSPIYPFIATAIVKGRWNISEYPKELLPLLHNYGIDRSARGEV